MSDGLAQYQRLFARNDPIARRRLDRASLPKPLRYLTERGLIHGKPRGEWVQITCPQHKGGAEAHPSMSVSLVDGHFACHACGAKGGDILALHRLITGAGFLAAVSELRGRFHD